MNAVSTAPFVPAEVETPVACFCPNCGTPFARGGRGLGKVFCSQACRHRFHAVQQTDGAAVSALLKAWHATRHAKPGTRKAAICRYARQQLTEIAGLQLERDEEAGRDAIAFVGHLMDSGTRYIDRTRK